MWCFLQKKAILNELMMITVLFTVIHSFFLRLFLEAFTWFTTYAEVSI